MEIFHARLDELEDGELSPPSLVTGGGDGQGFGRLQGVVVDGEQRVAGAQQAPKRLDGPVIFGATLVEVLEVGLEAGQLGQALA